VRCIRHALGTPCVRQEVAAWIGNKARVGGSQLTVAPSGHDCHDENVADSFLERFVQRRDITRIFSPDRTQTGLHGFACDQASKSYAVALSETIPVRAIFPRCIGCRAPAGAEQAAQETFWFEGRNQNPFDTLSPRDRLVRRLREFDFRFRHRLRRVSLLCLRRSQSWGQQKCRAKANPQHSCLPGTSHGFGSQLHAQRGWYQFRHRLHRIENSWTIGFAEVHLHSRRTGVCSPRKWPGLVAQNCSFRASWMERGPPIWYRGLKPPAHRSWKSARPRWREQPSAPTVSSMR